MSKRSAHRSPLALHRSHGSGELPRSTSSAAYWLDLNCLSVIADQCAFSEPGRQVIQQSSNPSTKGQIRPAWMWYEFSCHPYFPEESYTNPGEEAIKSRAQPQLHKLQYLCSLKIFLPIDNTPPCWQLAALRVDVDLRYFEDSSLLSGLYQSLLVWIFVTAIEFGNFLHCSLPQLRNISACRLLVMLPPPPQGASASSRTTGIPHQSNPFPDSNLHASNRRSISARTDLFRGTTPSPVSRTYVRESFLLSFADLLQRSQLRGKRSRSKYYFTTFRLNSRGWAQGPRAQRPKNKPKAKGINNSRSLWSPHPNTFNFLNTKYL